MKTDHKTRNQPLRRKQTGTWAPPACCLGCEHTDGYSIQKVSCDVELRGESFTVQDERWVCSHCHETIAGSGQMDASLRLAAAAYKKKHKLLTGEQIRCRRKKLAWTQKKLAEKSGVGIASIKRWETGTGVQTPANNTALRDALASSEHRERWETLTTTIWSKCRLTLPDSKSQFIESPKDEGLHPSYKWKNGDGYPPSVNHPHSESDYLRYA